MYCGLLLINCRLSFLPANFARFICRVVVIYEQLRWPRGKVDFGLIPSEVKPVTLKVIFTASLVDTQHKKAECSTSLQV